MRFLNSCLAICFCCLTFAPSTYALSQTDSERYNLALKLGQAGEYAKAEVLWQLLFEKNPNDLGVMNNLAANLILQGHYARAQTLLEKALASNPEMAKILQNLNAVYDYQAKLAYQSVFQEEKVEKPAAEWLTLSGDSITQKYQASKPTTPPPPPVQPVVEIIPDVGGVNSTESKDERADQVLTQVALWRTAWASKAVNRYLGFYQAGYRPNAKTSHKAWKASRVRSLSRPKFIEIELSDIQIVEKNAGQVEAIFWQKYRSNTYRDRVKKRLVWQKERQGWRIIAEQVLRGG